MRSYKLPAAPPRTSERPRRESQLLRVLRSLHRAQATNKSTSAGDTDEHKAAENGIAFGEHAESCAGIFGMNDAEPAGDDRNGIVARTWRAGFRASTGGRR